MTEHQTQQAHQPAPLWRRAAARLVDTCVMAVIEAVMIFVTFIVSALATGQDMLSDENLEAFYVLWLVLLVPASIPVYLYEVGATARSGQTFGKRLGEICVVPWDGEAATVSDRDRLEHWRYAARWAIPHAAGVVAAVVAAIVVLPSQDAGDFWGTVAGAAAVPWALVYASSLWDRNRRGWHDKAAGTIVVCATDDVIERLQERAAKGRGPHPQARPDQSKHSDSSRQSLPPPG